MKCEVDIKLFNLIRGIKLYENVEVRFTKAKLISGKLRVNDAESYLKEVFNLNHI